jgi:hypothetical protein
MPFLTREMEPSIRPTIPVQKPFSRSAACQLGTHRYIQAKRRSSIEPIADTAVASDHYFTTRIRVRSIVRATAAIMTAP